MTLLDRAVVAALPFVPKPMVRHFAAPYIAGETLDDAVRVVRQLNREGAMATIDVLGEAVTRAPEASAAADKYLPVIDAIMAEGLDANISIKPTMLGLGIDYAQCRANFMRVIERLRPHDMFLRIDMEDSPYTTITWELIHDLRAEYPQIGGVMQAYMRRSLDDLRTEVIPHNLNLRLCKGIYIEPANVAYQEFDLVRRNYTHLLRTALESGQYIGIATHDSMLVWEAYRIIEELKLDREQYEFQMLLGVQQDLRKQIIADGHRLRVYVPFGADWYAYSSRRLKENPKVAGYVFKDIFGIKH